MTSLAVQTPSVNWQVTAEIELVDASPEPTVSELVTPKMMGALDAEQGHLCVPEMYYTQWGQMLEYAEGFESVAGETILSLSIKNARRNLRLTDAQIEAHLQELRDGIEDDDFNRWGCSYGL